MKKLIDIYLSGGGVKCAYQITLLETLIKNQCSFITVAPVKYS